MSHTFEVDSADFQSKVLDRSAQVPVVVDFWAAWCAPCRQLGPALESAVESRGGSIELAKVDVDVNQALAQRFRVQGIPAVKAFKDGEVVAEFTGAIRPPQIEQFLDAIAPSEADRLVEAGDEQSLRAALEIDPRRADAAAALARILLTRGEDEEAEQLLSPYSGDFLVDGLKARLALAAGNGSAPSGLGGALSSWDEGDHEAALEALQEAIAAEQDDKRKDLIRRVMVAIFTELGVDHPLAREHRRRLAMTL